MRSLAPYLAAGGLTDMAYQMATVAVGWHIYALSNSPLYLGLSGLVQFLPTLLLVFGAGHAVDRYDRRLILALCRLAAACTAGVLTWATLEGHVSVAYLFGAVAVLGIAIAFENPASSALLPGIVPASQLQHATALSSGVWQVAAISGPALGGVVYALSPAAPYACMTVAWMLGGMLVWLVRSAPAESLVSGASVAAVTSSAAVPNAQAADESAAGLFAGVNFVRSNPVILGAISLDMCAVLLGGATALLPIYAKDILHTGPWGLGILRATPAAGALLMSAVLARHAIERNAGRILLRAVMIFGLATVVFSLSRSFWWSLPALAVMGAADTVSVVIRVSLVQLATPDRMRGRVGAVNYLFVNASNQLGEFESGLTAALLGPVAAAGLGGVGTIVVALLWGKLFPALHALQKLHPASEASS